MAIKPSSLIYGVEDKPPFLVLLLLGVQHVFLMSSTLILPVVLISEIGQSFAQVRAVVGLTMIACGLGTIIQSMRWRGIGSGFLCPNLCGPNFFAASAEAAWLGGLPLMRGMTIAGGVAEALFARVIHRLKFLFPPEITGMVVMMVAFGLVPLGASKFLGVNFSGEPIQGRNLLVAASTLMIMAGIAVWGGGKLKIYGVLIGMACGYLLSIALGLMTAAQYTVVDQASWMAVPLLDEGMWKLSFRWSLLPSFLIVSICGALKSIGNLIMCEKVNDEEWKGPDIKRIGDGLMADAICVTASGVLGGMASDTSASNVGLSKASGATSRRIGYMAGGLFMALGFSPKLATVLSVMPTPVMGSILIFVTCFMVISGLQIIMSAPIDTQKTFVIGLSIIFGLSLQVMPELYSDVYPWLRPLLNSPLTFSTVLAVILHQLLGPRRKQKSDIEEGARRDSRTSEEA